MLTADGLFSSSNPVEEGIPSPVTIYRLTEDEMEWMYAANGGDEGPDYYYQHLKRHTQKETKLPSLCDEWNILGIATPDGYDHFHTFTQRLTTDTIIGDIHYDAKLEQSGTYLGAMREGYNRDIYYIPNGTTHEYLLYAFNAQAGDTLNNMWVGGHFSEEHNGKRAVVREIRDTSPRTFVVEYEYTYNADKDTIWWPYYWIEGVGMSCGPSGVWCPFDCAGDYGELVLCAYKNGEQVYVSEEGKKYGCEYNGEGEQARLPSLCDEWNVMEKIKYPKDHMYETYKWRLTTDTVINVNHYAKIERNRQYKGALREEINGNIYFVYPGSHQECLLYAFNAQVGDTLTNTCLGNKIIIKEIRPTTPRTIVLDVEYDEYDEETYTSYWNVNWIEGIGYSEGTPISYAYPLGSIHEIDPPAMTVCAYKNGEQVYMADFADAFGCDYYLHDDYPADTIPDNNIPLFARDDSGSSTVDPVDPNQVVASLRGNELIIQEFMGVEITYTLRHKEPAKTPSSHRAPQSDTFRDEVTIPITESGEYLLEMTNPSWGYTIFGEFDYLPQGIETVHSNSTQHKVLLNGRLYIHHGDHIYDTQGKMIQ